MRRINLSHAQQQKLLADNRRKEIAREDQVKRINQERILEANMASEERIENKRFLRRLRQEATEREMDEGIRKVKAFCFIDGNTRTYFCLYLIIETKISTWSNVNGLLSKRVVKIAGYWPSSFLPIYGP